eukprot:2386162-Pyramimonas_sp.AAC.1
MATPTAVPGRCRGGVALKRAGCAPWPSESHPRNIGLQDALTRCPLARLAWDALTSLDSKMRFA